MVSLHHLLNLAKFKVFWTRIHEQLKSLKKIPNSAKFSGAVGNFNAHKVAYPKINWKNFGLDFVENKLGLNYSYPTTQIEHYDSLLHYQIIVKELTIFC